MHFVLQTPSLQHLAGIKTVAALWNHSDILDLIAELSDESEEDVEWNAVREKVESHMLALELTQPCKQQLLKFIKPLGREIFDWCTNQYICDEDNYDFPFLRSMLPRTFCWTMHGVIDYAKTAHLMVKDDSLAIERQYDLSCINCLEDEARELFESMGEERRQMYFNSSIDVIRNEQENLIAYFSCTLSGDVDRLKNAFPQLISGNIAIDVYRFFKSLFSGNRATSEYFFRKVTPDEKEFVLVKVASAVFIICRNSPHYNLLHYLSLMNEEQQERVFNTCIGDVLICLLGWPMQSLFMEAVKCGWSYMQYEDYENVLCALTSKISDDCQDYNYSQLFWECWGLTPVDDKRRLLDDVEFLERLYDTKKDEFMKLILNEAASHQIDALIARCCETIPELQEQFRVLMEEKEMSDAALMEWKETAALNDENDEEDEGKRLRRELIRLIDIKMESRKKRRLI